MVVGLWGGLFYPEYLCQLFVCGDDPCPGQWPNPGLYLETGLQLCTGVTHILAHGYEGKVLPKVNCT